MPERRLTRGLNPQLLRAVARAVAKLLVTLLALSAVTFVGTNAVQGDPARAALGRTATEAQLETFREQQGLNRPVLERYFHWLGSFVRGDWGTSLTNQRPVRADVQTRLARTIALALVGFFLIALPVAITLGLYTGKRPGSFIDRAVSGGVLLTSALPEFVIGILLLIVFAVWLGLFPVESSVIAFDPSLPTAIEAYALPATALALVIIPYVVRMMRANTREVWSEPYVRAAALRGLRGVRLTSRHVLPNASRPVVNVLALNLAEVIAGLVAIEAVFGFPGAGQLLVTAVQAQDFPVVQALTILIGGFFVTLNLIADLVLIALNPRLRS